MAQKISCANCHYFDNSAHKNDQRTHHAGICSKWSEVTFLTDSCKYHFDLANNKAWKELIAPKEHENQLLIF